MYFIIKVFRRCFRLISFSANYIVNVMPFIMKNHIVVIVKLIFAKMICCLVKRKEILKMFKTIYLGYTFFLV